MTRLSKTRIEEFFQIGETALTTTEKGQALERLACYIFEAIPGIEVSRRDVMNTFHTEEIDVAFWNNRQSNGLHFLPNIILVECKNWSQPTSSQEVAFFKQKLEDRGRDVGILISTKGITGDSEELTRAHYIIASALSHGLNIIVITREEIINLTDSTQLIKLLKEKLCELIVSGSMILK
jgi:hypothetical protein